MPARAEQARAHMEHLLAYKLNFATTIVTGQCLAGATGHIGHSVAEQLGKAGLDVTAQIRSHGNVSADRRRIIERLSASGVKFREGSLDQDVDTLAALISQYDIVIDLFWPAKITQTGTILQSVSCFS